MPGQKSFIPFNGIQRQYQNIHGELLHEMDMVMQSGDLLNGSRLASFEDKIANRVGREYAIAVNSGTNAIHYVFDLIERIRQLQFKTEKMGIAIPNYSFRSTRNSIINRGDIIPVDVDQLSGLMELNTLFAHRTIDVLMYVNLFGNMIDYEKLTTVVRLFIDNADCLVVEDACQSFGSTYKGRQSGSFGNFSVLSFDPTKNLSSNGGGGMILTDDHASAAWLWEYVRNGSSYTNEPKVNSTMSELDAASLLVRLKYFDKWQERRTEIANYYNKNLHESIITPDMTLTEGVVPNWHKYVILSDRRDTIAASLTEAQIETKIHYKITFESMVVVPELESIGARMMSNNVLSLPIYPELTDAEVERIVEEVNNVVCGYESLKLRPYRSIFEK